MQELLIFQIVKYLFLGAASVTFIILFFISAGYGRYNSSKWGPQMDNRAGWIVMESVSPILFFILFIFGSHTHAAVSIIFLIIWEIHYIHRAFIYPLLIRGKKTIPISIVLLAITFNFINSYLQGRYLFRIAPEYKLTWLYDPRFLTGLLIFITGFIINLKSDHILRNLRKPGDTGYSIPYGGMFKYISCPNYLGEIMEWFGWALLTWSLVGLIFAVWTAANLIPRAVSYHRWYREKFDNYPDNRKAIFPLIL